MKPVPRTPAILQLLRDFESRNVTFIEPDGSWPIVWERAKGVHVWDVEGRRYLDLTAAFGVAAAGHANPRVVRAGRQQMARLLHAMGDVHPHALKARLARRLSALTFERWLGRPAGMAGRTIAPATRRGKTIFANSGFEAVEAALKTALLATGRPGIIAFEGGYHGLGYGALNATHRDHFRRPFQSQLAQFGQFVPFPVSEAQLDPVRQGLLRAFRRARIGAILAEPVQTRGGINLPPREFLPLLRELCDRHGALLILDEIYTGFGRTGKWFACEQAGTVPDVVCLGKALTGGFPLSACVGRADLMDAAWPASAGEAIHTSTFLGHPVGCAMALAQMDEIERLKLPQRAAKLGKVLLDDLEDLAQQTPAVRCFPRGAGLLAGVELKLADGQPATQIAVAAVKSLLQQGCIVLPEGEHANVISFTPPLTISQAQLRQAVSKLGRALSSLSRAASR